MKVQYHRVGLLCRCKKNMWQNSRQIVRVAKRKKGDLYGWDKRYSYFVVGVGDEPGYGVWVKHGDLIVLTPLELLALQAED